MIKITDIARAKLISILDHEKLSTIRFGLQGSGCSGFSYYLTLDTELADDDSQIQLDATHIMVIDSMSSMYLESAEIDYNSSIMGESFVFNNPLVTTKCGCGNSVSF